MQLFARPGDAQALKGLAAARLASNPITLQSAQDVYRSHPNAFTNNTVALVVSSDVVLSDPNVIAKYLGKGL